MGSPAPREARRTAWYLRPVTIVIAILSVGPFALPLVWISPAFKRWQKFVITVIVLVITVYAFRAAADLYRILAEEMEDLRSALR